MRATRRCRRTLRPAMPTAHTPASPNGWSWWASARTSPAAWRRTTRSRARAMTAGFAVAMRRGSISPAACAAALPPPTSRCRPIGLSHATEWKSAGRDALAHDPEKACPALDAGWAPVGEDHAQTKGLTAASVTAGGPDTGTGTAVASADIRHADPHRGIGAVGSARRLLSSDPHHIANDQYGQT